uniref:Uncharacterized protein n=1 Tax=viral metagenome TaxID=1070528 RepID=A0A6M3JGG9_9ZZZZ
MKEIQAWLRNKNMSLFYTLKHKIGKPRAMLVYTMIDNLIKHIA